MRKYLKSFIKGALWEALGLIILFLLTHSFTIGITYVITRTILFVAYEAIWSWKLN